MFQSIRDAERVRSARAGLFEQQGGRRLPLGEQIGHRAHLLVAVYTVLTRTSSPISRRHSRPMPLAEVLPIPVVGHSTIQS